MASKAVDSEMDEYVLLLVGPSGAGKSMAVNYIVGEEVFSLGGEAIPGISRTTQHKFDYKGMSLRLIDTVGFDDPSKSPENVLAELTTAVLMAADAGGIHAVLICTKVDQPFGNKVVRFLDDLNSMTPIFDRCMLVFMNAGKCDATEDQLKEVVIQATTSALCLPQLSCLLHEVAVPRIFLEYDDFNPSIIRGGVREMKVDEIVHWVTTVVGERGVYTNKFMREAKQVWGEFKIMVKEGEITWLEAHEPFYSALAFEIVESFVVVPPECNPFCMISYGIKEFRRRRQVRHSVV